MRSTRGGPVPQNAPSATVVPDDLKVIPPNFSGPAHLALVVDENGIIQSCGDNCETVVGYPRGELESRHISKLVLQFLALPLFVNGQLNPLVSFLGHCDIPFLVQHRRGDTFSSRVSFIHLHHLDHPAIRVLISPPPQGHQPRAPAWNTGN